MWEDKKNDALLLPISHQNIILYRYNLIDYKTIMIVKRFPATITKNDAVSHSSGENR